MRLCEIIKYCKKNRWIIRALPYSIIFNLRNLPLDQALKLPIIVYKCTNRNNSGSYEIRGTVHFGMIRLGRNLVGIYPNDGIILENAGKVIFHGNCQIGNHSALSIGENGILEFGKDFTATAGLKIVCWSRINIEESVLVGWNCLLLDHDFHKLTYIVGNERERRMPNFETIKIGHDTWIANSCKIYKGVTIPPYNVVGSDTVLRNSTIECSYSLIYNKHEVSVRRTGGYLDMR